jgi:hypothetical protein
MSKEEKIKKLDKIKSMIEDFCCNHLTDEYEQYALKLFDTLSRKRRIDITRGKEEIWAASIVYVIARLNFLFDKVDKNCITTDLICDFFQTKKSTTGNKATQIEKECKLTMGAEGYCRDEITDSMTFYQTADGFIVPKSMFQKVVYQVANEEDAEEIRKFEEEQRKAKEHKELEKKRRRTEINRKIAEEKKKNKNKGDGIQLSF